MERTITVIESATNNKTVFNSKATTFRELKAEMEAKGIRTKNMDCFEGISRYTFTDDNAVLPSNLSYKGTTTNNLVFLLSTTKNKIDSGMDRQEIYAKIKEYNLAERIKNSFGKNFTQCSSGDLEEYINNYRLDAEYINSCDAAPSSMDLASRVTRLEDTVENIWKLLNNNVQTKALESPYSKEELADMFC
jgi:hypothetical protein